MFMIIIISLFGFLHGQSLTDVKQLYTDVFSTLNKEVMPTTDQSQPLDITLKFYLLTIANFEEAAETIVILGAIHMLWTDGGISWTPSSYGNKQKIPLTRNDIWTPSLTLYNSVDTFEPVGRDTDFTVNIYYNGSVSLISGDVMSAKCTTDVSKFPYDSQTCVLKFTPWNMFSDDVNLLIDANTPVDKGFYTENSDWTVVAYNASAYAIHGYLQYDVTLTMKRQSLYYSVMVVCPTILFGLLNPLVFILPVDSGERIGLAMTILLSYAIFLTLVSGAIPATSNPMCILLIIMMATIVISGVIVFLAIVISTLYHRDDTKHMNIVWKFIGTRLPWCKRENQVIPLSNDKKINLSEDWRNRETSWKAVADSLDTLSLIVSYLNMILLILVYFIYTA